MLEFIPAQGLINSSRNYWFGKNSAVFHSTSLSHLVTTGYIYDPRRNTVTAYNCVVDSCIINAQCSTTLIPNGVILADHKNIYTQDFCNDINVQPIHYAELPLTDRILSMYHRYRMYTYDKDIYMFVERSRKLYVMKSDQSPPRSWSLLPDMIHKRLAPYIIVTDTHIYAFGGKYSSNDYYKEGVDHEVFSLETGEWSIIFATYRNDKFTHIKLPHALHSYTFHREANLVFFFKNNALFQMVLDADHLYVSVRTKFRGKLNRPGELKLNLTFMTNKSHHQNIKTCSLNSYGHYKFTNKL